MGFVVCGVFGVEGVGIGFVGWVYVGFVVCDLWFVVCGLGVWGGGLGGCGVGFWGVGV